MRLVVSLMSWGPEPQDLSGFLSPKKARAFILSEPLSDILVPLAEVAHEVFAGPVPARRQPTPEPSPRQEQKVPQHAAHRVSVGMEQPGR